jgi:hypothetical protein
VDIKALVNSTTISFEASDKQLPPGAIEAWNYHERILKQNLGYVIQPLTILVFK